MNATRRDLEIQFKRAIANGWLLIFQREAKRAGVTTARLLGLGSRETNLEDIRGDFRGGIYHGFGILQVDIGTAPEYCRTWQKGHVGGGIVGGVNIYLGKVRDTQAYVGKKCSVKGRIFTGKAIEPDDLQRIATAAYNCGRWAYCHFSRGENVDSTTTGHDYSRDVYDRAVEFADMLEKGGHEQNAVAIELDAQGKYARRETQNRFQHLVIEDRLKLDHGDPQEAQDELAAVDYGHNDISAEAPADNPTGPNEPLKPATDPTVAPPPVEQPPIQPQDLTMNAPVPMGSTQTVAKTTIGGFVVPGALVAAWKVVSDLVDKGYVKADDIGTALLNFATNNGKYVVICIGFVVGMVVLKKVERFLIFLISMLTHAIPSWNSVKVNFEDFNKNADR